MPHKTRVLLAVSGFPPAQNYGGPAVSIDNLCRALQGRIDCAVVTVDHDLKSPERLSGIREGWNARDGFRVLYLRERELNLFRLREVVEEVAPDVIYLNSLFAAKFAIPLLKIGRERALPVLIAPRGELCPDVLSLKSYKKRPYLWLLRPWLKGAFFQATSAREIEPILSRARTSSERIFCLTELPTLPRSPLARERKERAHLRCLFMARIVSNKNLLGALQALRPLRGEISFDIYGPLEDRAYWAACEAQIAALPANIRAHYCGVAGRDAIHETFAQYDAFLFPTFSENYGHVIPEAMLSGCPVVTSDQTPWTDVNEAGAGWALALSDMGAFTAALQQIADMDGTAYRSLTDNVARYVEHKLKIPETVQAYVDCFEGLAGRGLRA